MATIFEAVEGQPASIRKTAEVITVTDTVHDVKFLIEQRVQIIRQLDEQVSARNRELAEVDELLREAAKLGIPEAVEWDKVNPLPVKEEGLPVPDLGGERIR